MAAEDRKPGPCADCGNDAYIQLRPRNGDEPDLVCAHCYAERIRAGKVPAPRASAPPAAPARGSTPLRRR